jgi:hypothetical protein
MSGMNFDGNACKDCHQVNDMNNLASHLEAKTESALLTPPKSIMENPVPVNATRHY